MFELFLTLATSSLQREILAMSGAGKEGPGGGTEASMAGEGMARPGPAPAATPPVARPAVPSPLGLVGFC